MLGGDASVLLSHVEPTPDGGLVLTGESHDEPVELTPNVVVPTDHGFVAKLSRIGEVEWAYGSDQSDLFTTSQLVAVAPDGRVVVAFSTKENLALERLDETETTEAATFHFGAALHVISPTGSLEWSGALDVSRAADLTVRGDVVFVSGETRLDMQGDDPKPTTHYVERRRLDGSRLDPMLLEHELEPTIDQVEPLPDGSIVVAGTYRDEHTVADAPWSTLDENTVNGFVAKFDADGSLAWHHLARSRDRFSLATVRHLAATPKGVVVSLSFMGEFDLSGTRIAGDDDLDDDYLSTLVFALDANGDVRWTKTFEGIEDQHAPSSLKTTPDGDVVLALALRSRRGCSREPQLHDVGGRTIEGGRGIDSVILELSDEDGSARTLAHYRSRSYEDDGIGNVFIDELASSKDATLAIGHVQGSAVVEGHEVEARARRPDRSAGVAFATRPFRLTPCDRVDRNLPRVFVTTVRPDE